MYGRDKKCINNFGWKALMEKGAQEKLPAA
jgi:hypothetical protein